MTRREDTVNVEELDGETNADKIEQAVKIITDLRSEHPDGHITVLLPAGRVPFPIGLMQKNMSIIGKGVGDLH